MCFEPSNLVKRFQEMINPLVQISILSKLRYQPHRHRILSVLPLQKFRVIDLCFHSKHLHLFYCKWRLQHCQYLIVHPCLQHLSFFQNI